MNAAVTVDWRDHIFEVLQDHGIRQVYHVPDAGHSRLIEACQKSNSIRTLALTTEEEGIPLAAGAWLGGQRSVLLMQSSGLGNCLNFMSMVKGGRFPFLTVLSMRGEFGEGNPWQMGMGQATKPLLAAMDFIALDITKPEEVTSTVDAASNMVWKSGQAVAILLTQKLIGAKNF